MRVSLKQLVIDMTTTLRDCGVQSYQIDARILIKYVIGIDDYILFNKDFIEIEDQKIRRLNELLERKKSGEPIAYLVGYKEFYGRNFITNQAVLIPRPETEFLVDLVLEDYRSKSNISKVLELGIGSGCISISLLAELENLEITGVDVSEAALDVAKQNAIQHDVVFRLELLKSDLFQNVRGAYDAIVSNPPYISKSFNIYRELTFEPKIALFADNDGLAYYTIIARDAKRFLSALGAIYLEIGLGQKNEVVNIFNDFGYTLSAIKKDLQGYDRCLKFIIKELVSNE